MSETLEQSALNSMSLSKPSPLKAQEFMQKRQIDIKSQTWWVTLQENSLPDTIGLMASNTVTELTRITQAQTRQNPSTEERNWIKSPPLSKKLSSVKGKTRFLKWRVHWVYQPHSRAGPMARSSLTAQNWLHGFLHPYYLINSSVCLMGWDCST